MEIQVSFFQESTSVDMKFNTLKTSNKVILGTTLSELFEWVKVQKAINSKGLKLSEVIDIKITSDKLTFDSSKYKHELNQVLKLQNNFKGRKRFALKFKAIFDYCTKDFKTVQFDSLIEELTQEIELN